MPIMKSTTALTVFETVQPKAVTREALMARRFFPIDATADERSFGWVPFDDQLSSDTEAAWASAIPEKGNFMAFALRVDTRRVPGPILKKCVREAIEAEKKNENKAFISKERKREIKEREKLRLTAKTMPVPATYDVVLDVTSGRIFLAATTQKAKDLFAMLWNGCFNEMPLEQAPFVLAGSKVEPGGVDFLTAIYSGEIGGGEGDDDAMLTIDNKVTFISSCTSVAVATDNLGKVAKAVEALEQPCVAKAKVHVVTDGEEFDVTLAGDFSMTGLKTPKVDARRDDDNPDGAFLEKMYLIDKCVRSIHGAFTAFVEEKGAV